METRQRTVVKAVFWNVLGLSVMALVGLGFTGSVALGGAMAVVNAGLGLVFYVVYERLWQQIAWGRHG